MILKIRQAIMPTVAMLIMMGIVVGVMILNVLTYIN